MRLLSLFLLALVLGCSNRAEVTAPENVAVGTPAIGHTAAAQFKGFDFPDYEVMVAAHDSGLAFYASADSSVDKNLRLSIHQTSWNSYTGQNPPCTNAFTYLYEPLVLFPDGHEFDEFQVSIERLLCADIVQCSDIPYFFDSYAVTFAGVRHEIPSNPENGRYLPNQVFEARHKGWRAKLVINEYLVDGLRTEVNGAHLTLTKGRKVLEVKLAHVDMTVCP